MTLSRSSTIYQIASCATFGLVGVFLTTPALAEVCYPKPSIQAGELSGPPIWTGSGTERTELNEPRWAAAPQKWFESDLSGTEATYRIMVNSEDNELSVSIQVRADPGTASEEDRIFFGLTTDGVTGSTAEAVRLGVPSSGTDPAPVANARAYSYSLTTWSAGAPGVTPVWVKDARAWRSDPTAEWGINFKVNLAAMGILPSDTPRIMIAAQIVNEAISGTELTPSTPDPGCSAATCIYPLYSDTLLIAQPSDWFQTSAIDSGCPGGITISDDQLGTTNVDEDGNPAPHQIDTTPGATNTFYARPSYDDAWPPYEGMLQARFYIAGVGSSASPDAVWTPIQNGLQVENGDPNSTEVGEFRFTCPKNEEGQVCGVSLADDVQPCVYVELREAPGQVALISQATAYFCSPAPEDPEDPNTSTGGGSGEDPSSTGGSPSTNENTAGAPNNDPDDPDGSDDSNEGSTNEGGASSSQDERDEDDPKNSSGGGASGSTNDEEVSEDAAGCGCHTGPKNPSGSAWWVALGLGVALLRRRSSATSNQARRASPIVLVALLVAAPRAAWAQTVCVPEAVGVQGLPGGPDWSTTLPAPMPAPAIDDPRWLGAAQQTFPAPLDWTKSDISARIIHQGGRLYLQLQALEDANAGTQSGQVYYDNVYVGFADESYSNVEIAKIAITNIGETLVYRWTYGANATCGSLWCGAPAPPQWITDQVGWVTTAVSGSQVGWTVSVEIALDALPGTKFWYGAGFALLPNVNTQTYAWPSLGAFVEPAPPDTAISAGTWGAAFELIADPNSDKTTGDSAWGELQTYSGTDVPDGCTGLVLSDDAIGLAGVDANIFTAQLSASAGAALPPAGSVRGRFRVADCGDKSTSPSAWEDIPGGAFSDAIVNDASGLIQFTCADTVGCPSLDGTSEVEQCLLVEVQGIKGSLGILRDSAIRRFPPEDPEDPNTSTGGGSGEDPSSTGGSPSTNDNTAGAPSDDPDDPNNPDGANDSNKGSTNDGGASSSQGERDEDDPKNSSDGGATGSTDDKNLSEDAAGCGCHTGPKKPSGSAWWVALGAFALILGRRRLRDESKTSCHMKATFRGCEL